MAFENFPSAETPQPAPAPQSPKSNLRSYVTVALIIALLATWGYIIWDKSKTDETIEQKDKQYSTVVSEKDTLQGLLDEATNRYDDLKTSNAKKDSTITAKDKEIADKQTRIKSILTKKNATDEELAQARLMIASLNQDIDGYKAQVDSLKTANTELAVEKQQVTDQRDQVQRNLDSTNTIVKQQDTVIDIGSTLHISHFAIEGLEDKHNGKEKETTDAKKVNKLRISFDIDENLISPSGNKALYVCITGPDGKPISVESEGSGEFTTRDGQSKSFTQKVDVNYVQAQKQTVSFDWKQTTPFAIGDYKIEVYNNGFKVGEGVQHLKKGGLFG
jgi:hypothetical protein